MVSSKIVYNFEGADQLWLQLIPTLSDPGPGATLNQISGNVTRGAVICYFCNLHGLESLCFSTKHSGHHAIYKQGLSSIMSGFSNYNFCEVWKTKWGQKSVIFPFLFLTKTFCNFIILYSLSVFVLVCSHPLCVCAVGKLELHMADTQLQISLENPPQ